MQHRPDTKTAKPFHVKNGNVVMGHNSCGAVTREPSFDKRKPIAN